MPFKMVDSGRNEDVLKDIEWRVEPLDEIVDNVIVCIGAVVKNRAKGGLPLLRLQNPMCIRLIVEETFEIVFSNRPALRTRRQSEISKICNQIRPVDKSNLWVEIRLHGLSLHLGLHEVIGITDAYVMRPVFASQL